VFKDDNFTLVLLRNPRYVFDLDL